MIFLPPLGATAQKPEETFLGRMWDVLQGTCLFLRPKETHSTLKILQINSSSFHSLTGTYSTE